MAKINEKNVNENVAETDAVIDAVADISEVEVAETQVSDGATTERKVVKTLVLTRKPETGKDGRIYNNYSVTGRDPVLDKPIVANFIAADRMGWGVLNDIWEISEKTKTSVHLAVSYNENTNSKGFVVRREVFEAHIVDPMGIQRSYKLKTKADSDLSNVKTLLQILKIS